MDECDFASRVEELIREAVPAGPDEGGDFSWDSFHAPLLRLVREVLIAGGQQDPDNPGQIRIDMGTTLPYGGLKPNDDTVLVFDFIWIESADEYRFFAKYNLADELIRYAETGEQGWDIARQIDQLHRTIARLKAEAAKRGWSLPELDGR